ncbi:DUF2306 domain-containing protein [Streptomyces boninensis]|uniref:DUF2306 domain-containing protein n=1 Tax=Streptomyces boninensis TaxID=2039455 RepID=UPI003B20D878
MPGPPDGAPAPGTATPRRGWVLLTVAVIAGAMLVSPYATFDSGSSRLGVSGDAHYYLVVAHVLTAGTALVLGPLQFIPAVRAHRRLHRAIGRAYLLAGVLPAALTAIPVALLSDRLLTQIGLITPALGWLATGWLAVQSARTRDYEAHRAWMQRNYALTFLAVTSRAVVPLLLLAQLGDHAADMIPVGQVLGWIINLAVAELLIRRRRARRDRTGRQAARV